MHLLITVCLVICNQSQLPAPQRIPSVNPTVNPAATTPSFYSSSNGPSRYTGWPTSLYGAPNQVSDSFTPVPYFLVYQPGMTGSGSGLNGACSGCSGNYHKRKIKCFAEFNCPGCGNFRTDAIFIFGSCRAFFGEACVPGQACPTPWDLLYGPNRPPQ